MINISNYAISIELSANIALTVLRCESNYLDVQEGSKLWIQIQVIGEHSGTMLIYEQQKMRKNFLLNAHNVFALTQFANQGDNLSKLGWDLSKPETWDGINWFYANNEYHVQGISINNLGLTGDLDLSGMEQLVRVFCNNNNLSSIDVSDSNRLYGLYCRNAGIRKLNISNTETLTVLDCEDNYLNITDIINDIHIISVRENAWVTYDEQK